MRLQDPSKLSQLKRELGWILQSHCLLKTLQDLRKLQLRKLQLSKLQLSKLALNAW